MSPRRLDSRTPPRRIWEGRKATSAAPWSWIAPNSYRELLDRRGPLLRPGDAELAETFGEKVAEHRLAPRIARGGTPTASFRGLLPQILPFPEGSVAAAEPRQRDEIDLLVLTQRIDKA